MASMRDNGEAHRGHRRGGCDILYLKPQTPQRPMAVDATWPLAAGAFGLSVNERFVWGKEMRIACTPIETLVVPEDEDAHAFTTRLLARRFSRADLTHRELFIRV